MSVSLIRFTIQSIAKHDAMGRRTSACESFCVFEGDGFYVTPLIVSLWTCSCLERFPKCLDVAVVVTTCCRKVRNAVTCLFQKRLRSKRDRGYPGMWSRGTYTFRWATFL